MLSESILFEFDTIGKGTVGNLVRVFVMKDITTGTTLSFAVLPRHTCVYLVEHFSTLRVTVIACGGGRPSGYHPTLLLRPEATDAAMSGRDRVTGDCYE